MANNLSLKNRFANFLFGTPVEGAQPQSSVQYQYPTQQQADFMNNFRNNQELINKIQASPYYQGYSDDELFNRVGQGQNFGLKELADEQKKWNIVLPRANNALDEAALEGNYLNIYQPKLQTGVSNAPRQGGLINDFMGGLRENYNEGLQAENLMSNPNKGWATRLGEGFGTALRFADKPIGRFALATGLSALTGETNPLAEGVTAYVGRQQNRLSDQVYRKDLINSMQNSLRNSAEFINATSEQQAQMLADIENQVNNYRGNFTADMYKNILSAQQLRDNADYRNTMTYLTAENNRAMQQYRQDQLEARRLEREADRADRAAARALTARGQDLDSYYRQQKLDLERQKAQAKTKNERQNLQKVGDIQAVEQQLNNFSKTFKNLPGKAYTYTIGAARAKTGLQSKSQAQFESQRTLLFNKIARDLGGEKGVLSDQDIKRIEDSLPKFTDNYDQKVAKMNAIYDLLNIQKARYNVQNQTVDSDNDGWAF